jgi:hypothetical protein
MIYLHSIAIVNEPYGDVVNSQGVAQHLEVKSSSRPASPYTGLHQGGSVVVQSNHPTHVVVLQPTQLSHGKGNCSNYFQNISKRIEIIKKMI